MLCYIVLYYVEGSGVLVFFWISSLRAPIPQCSSPKLGDFSSRSLACKLSFPDMGGVRFRVQGLGFSVWGLGFGFRFRV